MAQIPNLQSTNTLGVDDQAILRQGTIDKRIGLNLAGILSWARRNDYNHLGEHTTGIQFPDTVSFTTFQGKTYFVKEGVTLPYSSTSNDPSADTKLYIKGEASLKDEIYSTVGNTNLLSNHNFLITSTLVVDATPQDVVAGVEIFSGVFAGSTGIQGLTYDSGYVSFTGGDLYFPVSNSGALEYVTEFTASVADFDGKPRTRGVSFALVGDEYRVTVGVDALEDAGGNATPLGSVKFEQGSVATGHDPNSLSARNLGDYIGPKNASQDVEIEKNRQNSQVQYGKLVDESRIIAHQGFNQVSKTNTMMAYTNAINFGAQEIEMDIQVTSDGYLVCFHDSTVDVETDGTGTISSKTLAEVRALRFTSLAGTFLEDDKIPLFSELLDFAKANNVFLWSEIKEYRSESDIQLILDEIDNADMSGNVCLISSLTSDLQYVRTLNPDIAVGKISASFSQPVFDDLKALGNAWYILNYTSVQADPSVPKTLKDAGVGLVTFTIGSQFNVRKTKLANSNAFTTDWTIGRFL